MVRLLTSAFLLWAGLFLWSSNASAATTIYQTQSEADAACQESYSAQAQTPATQCTHGSNEGSQYDGHYAYHTKGYNQYHVFRYYNADPVCESPNYIDGATGECVPPEQICYTTLETMADECVYIGEDDPNDQVPAGCVVNGSGKEICLTEEPGCYTVNGFNYCPDPAEVCGMKNGAFSCVNPEEEGCGYFNGEKVCLDPTGNKVEESSPDHPDNGGNLDGNPENDMMDPRDETEGGDPNKQVDGGTIEPTTDADRATEKTSREQLQELKKLNKTLEQMSSGTAPTGSEAADKIEAAKNGLIAETGIDGVIDGIGSNPFGSGDLGGVPSMADGLIPQGTCVAYSKDVLGFGTFEITCDDTALLRTILAWVLYVLTAIYLFQLLTTPIGSKD